MSDLGQQLFMRSRDSGGFVLVVIAIAVHATIFFWTIPLRARREAVEALSSVHKGTDGLLEQIATFANDADEQKAEEKSQAMADDEGKSRRTTPQKRDHNSYFFN